MTREEFINIHWRYYIMLEKSFDKVLQYVELDEKNYTTFSIEFARQLQGICAEIDTVMKVICGIAGDERANTKNYRSIIVARYDDILSKEVTIGKISIKPFETWTKDKPTQSLSWFLGYNNLKHSRTTNYMDANLKNVLYALAGLFLLEMYYVREIAQGEERDIPLPASELFHITDWETVYRDLSGLTMKCTGKQTII